MVEQSLFQEEDSGSTPTSPLQLLVRPISQKTAGIMYSLYHYLKDTEFLSSFDYGIYWNQKCEGAISYGSPNAKKMNGLFDENTQSGWWEIKRLALSPLCPKNSESRFISVSLRLLKKITIVRGIISLADSAQNHVGTIYKASGFEYRGLTAYKCDYVLNGKKLQRGKVSGMGGAWVPRSKKHLFVKNFTVSPNPEE